MKKIISNFKVYLSNSIVEQESSTSWLNKYHGSELEDHFTKYSVKEKYISKRHIYSKGVADIPYEGEALYSIDEEISPNINKRSSHAQEQIDLIFNDLYHNEEVTPEHINHVSCTHYESPSGAQRIVVANNWGDNTTVTHLYHMGCYASMPAIRVSKSYISDGAQNVDIVHTELCSFHLDKSDTTAEQIIMKTLFADGAIKYQVSNEEAFKKKNIDGLEIVAQKEVIVPGTENDMTWKIGTHGFLMTLTRNVPYVLAKSIEGYVRDIFSDAELDYMAMKDKVIFAIHPGGPMIVQLIQDVLRLSDRQVQHSNHILKTRGNMSSATIPHIWNEIIDDQTIIDGTYIFTVAFGPGLTMTGAILKLCRF